MCPYKMNFQHTQKTLINITSVVPFGQELVQMLYTTKPLSSLPLHLSGGGNIPMYMKGYSNDASGGDAANELTFEKKPRRWQRVGSFLTCRHLFHLRKKTKRQRQASQLIVIFYTWETN